MGEDPAELPLNLVCFDEIDALCRRRGSLSGDTSGVRDSVVNQVRVGRAASPIKSRGGKTTSLYVSTVLIAFMPQRYRHKQKNKCCK